GLSVIIGRLRPGGTDEVRTILNGSRPAGLRLRAWPGLALRRGARRFTPSRGLLGPDLYQGSAMLDIKWIRENPEALIDALKKRQWSPEESRSTVEDIIAKDEARRQHIVKLQEAQERRNAASREIGNAMRNKDMAAAEQLKAEVAEIKGFIQSGEAT